MVIEKNGGHTRITTINRSLFKLLKKFLLFNIEDPFRKKLHSDAFKLHASFTLYLLQIIEQLMGY